MLIYFFFSSRRRHTRSKRDWSSDVCSSDLNSTPGNPRFRGLPAFLGVQMPRPGGGRVKIRGKVAGVFPAKSVHERDTLTEKRTRSEERRVGKESRTRWEVYT